MQVLLAFLLKQPDIVAIPKASLPETHRGKCRGGAYKAFG